MENYNLFDKKLEDTLSGLCLTSIREENKKIVNKYSEITENVFFELKKDFITYIKNYLILKKYNIKNTFEDGVVAEIEGKDYEFLIDYDWSEKQEKIKLKILDKGLKNGISKYDCKFLFIISLTKNLFYLFNNENLKNNIKENKEKFDILTENTELFKTKYVVIDLNNLNQRAKTFQLK